MQTEIVYCYDEYYSKFSWSSLSWIKHRWPRTTYMKGVTKDEDSNAIASTNSTKSQFRSGRDNIVGVTQTQISEHVSLSIERHLSRNSQGKHEMLSSILTLCIRTLALSELFVRHQRQTQNQTRKDQARWCWMIMCEWRSEDDAENSVWMARLRRLSKGRVADSPASRLNSACSQIKV